MIEGGDREKPVGIFDSGIGGLTVLREVQALLPGEHLLYLGDTARVPYGIKSPETVTRYSFECAEFMMQRGVKLLVVACNTVSAISIDRIRARIDVPVVGVIEPGAKAAVGASRQGRIGVIGTETTIRSEAYVRAIRAMMPSAEVRSRACPLFVPLAEEGWTEGEIVRLIAERYLDYFSGSDIDTLVLGCTHYPLLKGVIQSVMGGVTLIDSAIEIAKVVRDVLGGLDLLRNTPEASVRRFFVTDSPESFIRVGGRFLGEAIDNIERTEINSLR